MSGKKIKVLRIDKVKEYTSEIFRNYCKRVGIKREISVPYTQQIGVAERKYKTIVKAAKAMLHDQNLEIVLWGKASNTVVFVQNRCPHSHLEHQSSEEAFSRKKLDLQSSKNIWVPCLYAHS